ncbi:MAG TPA: UDP-3-O-(3-hydroxymyristoyl)glucosamine N-acyltransferase [Candidatus Brocadiia bacterium]|nr:UDP-3-O-(3-hydroxymyristoyl)glucosamine N-acyltransferase [Planctomycetota bacterium]MDO8093545.1 UDP-3-O-(3-hydroxymyristoyl)glucosamine N-acyltransferase [Candidatus Brocadiales bacterium]
MNYTLSQIQSIIGGKLIGDSNLRIIGVGSINNAAPGDITFIKDEAFVDRIQKTNASAVVVHRVIDGAKKPLIVVDNPFLAFSKFLAVISKEKQKRPTGIHPTAIISKNALIGKDISIGAYVVIEDDVKVGDRVTIYPNVFVGHDSTIGDDSIIYPNVTIREEVIIGKRAIIHAGTVIGDDGFGYLQARPERSEGSPPTCRRHVKIPQVGTVEIGDDVEIGANVTIARAALDKTVIGRGVKIDNHSHIAHNVIIGEDSMLIAYAKIAGGAVIGKNVMIAEDVGVTDHAKIGDNCVIGGGSNVFKKSLEPGSIVWGSPAKPINLEKRIQALIKKLPQMMESLRELSKKIG